MKKSHLIGALCAGVFGVITATCYVDLTPKLGGQSAIVDGDTIPNGTLVGP